MFQSVSEEVIRKALAMYTAKDTRYLKDAQIDKSDDTINLVANFSIYDCCYSAPNSGHFNAVEAIICLNQMFYVTLLGGIDKKMFSFYGKLNLKPLHRVGDKMYYDGCFGFGNDKECKSFTGHVKGFIPIL